MDAPTISAFAASAAAAAATAVGLIQLYVGHRQSKAALIAAKAAAKNAESTGRYKVAEFRQKWIDTVIETLSLHHSLAMRHSASVPASPEETMKAMTLRTKLELLLNPNEAATENLLKIMDEIPTADGADRQAKNDAFLEIARNLLKAEWVRIKEELK
jgi:hypothetical protein